MSVEQKLLVAQGLRNTAWQLVRAGVRAREPRLSDAEVEERVRLTTLWQKVSDQP